MMFTKVDLKLSYQELEKIFSKIELFSNVSQAQREEICKNFSVIKIEADKYLFHAGEEAKHIFVVYSGKLKILKDNFVFGSVGHGEIIGEMSLFTLEGRTASVQATRDSYLLQLDNEIIFSVLQKNTDLIVRFASLGIKRTKELIQIANQGGLPPKVSIIALVPTASTSEDYCLQFSIKLLEVMSTYIKCKLIFPETVGWTTKKTQTSGFHEVLLNISKEENQYEQILLFCKGNDFAWNKLCVDNADTILHIADEKSSSDLSEVERYLLDKKKLLRFLKRYIVFIREQKNNLHHKKWLSIRNDPTPYYIDFKNKDSIARIVRILTGRATGLILSGGGVNGYAHIGAFKALLENKISIDGVMGVSAGAVIAAMIAMNMSVETMVEKARWIARYFRWKKFTAFQIPVISFVKPSFFENMYQKIFNDIEISDMPLPFFCEACNLRTRKEVVFDKGMLKDVIIASGAIPGLFSPKVIDGEIYIDGGVMNTLPAEKMKILGYTKLIGVCVSRTRSVNITNLNNKNRIPSTCEIALNKLGFYGKKSQYPLIFDLLNSSLVIGSKNKLNASKKILDLFIEPDLSNISILDYGKFESIIEIGYREALKQIDKFKDKLFNKNQ